MSDRDRVVLITGAAGQLGRAVAQAFADAGFRRVLLDRALEPIASAFGAEDDRQMFAAGDLMVRAEAQASVRSALRRFGRIDVLVNVAGGFTMGEAVHEISDETWNGMMDLNARSVLHACHAVVPHMLEQGGGRIVNVAAFAAQHGQARKGAYGASKSVVVHLTEAMAAELREQGINVNCVMPTIIDTPANRASMPDADPSRWVAPADLAQVILFLASDAARAVHGAALAVTGLS